MMIQDKPKSSLRSASVKFILWQEIKHFIRCTFRRKACVWLLDKTFGEYMDLSLFECAIHW